MKTRRLALMIALVSVLPAAPSAFAAVTNGSAPDLGAYEYVPEPAGLGLLAYLRFTNSAWSPASGGDDLQCGGAEENNECVAYSFYTKWFGAKPFFSMNNTRSTL
jgi:hypothetical protein